MSIYHSRCRLLKKYGWHYISSNLGVNKQLNNLTSVIIVGGGPTGLLLSALLTQYGVSSILLEARSPEAVARHPQAHYINLRSMEIIRHNMPHLYAHIQKSMPPSSEWKAFTFSHSILGRQITRVIHPVDNLQVGQDGNGTVDYGSIRDDGNANSRNISCSPCSSPGHLAQNVFSTLLLDEARRNLQLYQSSESNIDKGRADILHRVKVVNIFDHGLDRSSHPLSVHTACGQIFHSKFVVAADGSSSPARSSHGEPNIMKGESNIQHLMNIHFRTSPALSTLLMTRQDRIGMLHFVYNSELVGAFVCHNLKEGEWVLQIPFFPPFESPDEFTEDKVNGLIEVGIFGEHTIDHRSNYWKILHVKPWTMNALVSDSYLLGKSKRIILAGDAAHIFPPAGGFGMNTGLQDSHNLSWRLALLCGHDEAESRNAPSVSKLLSGYEAERKHIATINSALSVRNYKRTLDIAKAFYLNADHPTFLKMVMESTPATFLPFSLRRDAFNLAVRIALKPLSDLAKEGTILGERIVKNVLRILDSGGGLPLLFPQYEIGFSYNLGKRLPPKVNDTEGYVPSLSVGARLPHVELYVLGRFGRMSHEIMPETLNCAIKNKSAERQYLNVKTPLVLTLTDLGSQYSMRWVQNDRPNFSLLLFHRSSSFISTSPSPRLKLKVLHSHLKQYNILVDVFELFEDLVKGMERVSILRQQEPAFGSEVNVTVMHDHNKVISTFLEYPLCDTDDSVVIIVRPDGHILYIGTLLSDGNEFDEHFYEMISTKIKALMY